MLQRTWEPLAPAVLLALVRDSQRRLVESADHLLDIVIESLRRLEQELQGETPGAPDLWNHLPNGEYSPKDENAFTDYVARFLRRDLIGRKIVVNREVEIRRGEGDAQGERTDIHIDAFVPGASGRQNHITVIVETKGCWNAGLKTDLEKQLRDRYLTESACRHGLYLVGWFTCPQWDASDNRWKKSPKKMTQVTMQQFFDQQSDSASTNGVHIRALVLNAALR